MKLFKLSGNTSKIELRLEHPIHLDGNYSIGLSGFYSDNFVKNVPDIPYAFKFNDDNKTQSFNIDNGYYSIDDIHTLFYNS
ncbi:hypothetical protein, partial [Vibrio cholerae]|uniref:hypothetical protein n=1 Tax=Vibrio cholerae TaxID=666 RepID=UPI001961D4E4